MGAKKIEQKEIQTCSITGRQFLASEFPKLCSCCKKEFNERQSYWDQTSPLEHGNYSRGSKNHIFEYRNCNDCSSTLVTKFVDERDASAEGVKKREQWKQQFQFLVSNGIPEERAKSILASKKIY